MSTAERITPEDIESKLRELRGEVTETAASAREALIAAGVLVGAAVVGLAYWLGRRRGRRSTTVVEIRRV